MINVLKSVSLLGKQYKIYFFVNKMDNNIVIDGIKYSVEEMAATHPGGDLFVKAFAGRDATTAFMS